MNQDIVNLKREVHQHCVAEINTRIGHLKDSLKGFQDAANEETKSSAGDKYETGRAMMHLEKEKVAHSLNEVLKQKKVLDQLSGDKSIEQVALGSLVVTNRGVFYISISLGQVKVSGQSIFCISPVSPLGQGMTGSVAGAQVVFNNVTYEIQQVV